MSLAEERNAPRASAKERGWGQGTYRARSHPRPVCCSPCHRQTVPSRAAPQKEKGQLHPEPPPCSHQEAGTNQQVNPLVTQGRGSGIPSLWLTEDAHRLIVLRGEACLGFQKRACLWGWGGGLGSRARGSLWRGWARKQERRRLKPGRRRVWGARLLLRFIAGGA